MGRVKVEDKILTYSYTTNAGNLETHTLNLEKISKIAFMKLKAISKSKYNHQKDMAKTAREILKILNDQFPEVLLKIV